MAQSSKNRTVRIDARGVDKEIRRSGRAAKVPEGDYLLRITNGDLRDNKNGDGRHFAWTFQIISPKEYKGKNLYMVTSLKHEALWNLRNLIYSAIGKNIAGSVVNFNPATIEGKVVAATTEDSEYTNPDTGRSRVSSQVVDIRPKDQLESEEDDDEDEDDEVEDDEEEYEDEDEEDEDEDEEPPVKSRAKAKAKAKPAKKKRPVEDDEDEDEDLDDVDIEDI